MGFKLQPWELEHFVPVSASGRRSPPGPGQGQPGDLGRQVESTEKYKKSSKMLRKKVKHVKENGQKRIKLNNLLILRFVTVLKEMRGKELSFAVSSLP